MRLWRQTGESAPASLLPRLQLAAGEHNRFCPAQASVSSDMQLVEHCLSCHVLPVNRQPDRVQLR